MPNAIPNMDRTVGELSVRERNFTESAREVFDLVPSVPLGTGRRAAVSGISVADVLALSSLHGAHLLAGASGLHRLVRRLNVMEVPDVLPWVKADELILTTGYPLRQGPERLTSLIGELDDRGLAAIGIKLARYIDELPADMLTEADRRGFPLIQLPDDIGFDDILNEVLTEILNKQAAALAQSDEVHRAIIATVLAGGGLDEVTAKAAALLDPATVIAAGPEGAILASSGPDAHRIAAIPDVAARQAAVPNQLTVDGVGDAVVVPITAGDFEHGWLVAVRSDSAHPPQTITILERAAALAALTITQKLAVTAVETRYQSDLVRDLVGGRIEDLDRVLDQAKWFGWNISDPLVLAVTNLAAPQARTPRGRHDDLERFAGRWRPAIEAQLPGAAVVVVSDQVVSLLPIASAPSPGAESKPTGAADPAEVIATAGARVVADLHGSLRPESTGFSRTVDSLQQLPAAYAQARRAAQVGLGANDAGAIIGFDALGVLRLLSLIPDSDELRNYIGEVLGPLIAAPQTGGGASPGDHADLRKTLRVLLVANLNVASAARSLHVHYNTLRYRIGRLERLLGPFMTDPAVRLDIQLALHLVDVHGLG